MKTNNFLFELGLEEIPAGFIDAAMQKITSIFKNNLVQKKLIYKEIKLYSTPRRLAIQIRGLQEKQADETIERNGPAKKIAMDENGQLTKAGLGFCRSAGARAEDVTIINTPKGEYLFVKVFKPGVEATTILKNCMQEVLNNLDFPKSMRWGIGDYQFARPLRWLVALWGSEILEIEKCGVMAGRVSYGIRYVKLTNKVEIPRAIDYEACLKKVNIIANREERQAIIKAQMVKLMANCHQHIVADDKLMETVTDLVEYPTVIRAYFDKKYLELPAKIITSTLSQHQKYFAVANDHDDLCAEFVFVANGDSTYTDIIRAGNEKVIKARLEDAQFFWQEDKKISLEDYVKKLAEVTFQQDLGSLLDKTERITEICDYITSVNKLSAANEENCRRCALLCKADLVTLMLGEKEFTKLQGYMGQNYARAAGEVADVCLGIYEHYMPRGQNDTLPSTIVGAITAIADKIDTVCGICGVGMLPSGSNDPFALRRAANGVVRIIEANDLEIDIYKLIDFCYDRINSRLKTKNQHKEFVYEYFQQRIKWLLGTQGMTYDVIDSVMQRDAGNIGDIKRRAVDLQTFRDRDDFVKLVIAYKRVSNISSKESYSGKINPALFEKQAEEQLYAEKEKLSKLIPLCLTQKDYKKVMEMLVAYGVYIDKFFEDVLVNTDDEAIKRNRYLLLKEIKNMFQLVADLDKIVVETKN